MNPVRAVAPVLSALALAALTGAWTPEPTTAQEPLPVEAGEPLGAQAGFVFQGFRFSSAEATGIESLSLATLPISARADFGGRFRAELRSAFARGRLGWERGGETTLAGLTDTEVRLGVALVEDAVTVTAIGSLPTGENAHDPEQVILAGAVAADLLPLEISHWAGGGGGGVAASAVHSFGPTGVGVDLGYRRSGEFQPTREPEAQYRPGDLFYATAVLDRAVSPTGTVTVRVDARYFGDDEVDGENLFRTGNRVAGTASYAFGAGSRSTGLVYGGYRHRSAGTFLLALQDRPSQDLLVAGGALRTPVAKGTVTPRVDVRMLRREDGLDQGYNVGIGADGHWEVGRAAVAPSVRLRVGSVDLRADQSSGFQGLDLGLRVGAGGTR